MRDFHMAQWTAHLREELGHTHVSRCCASSTGVAHRLPKKTPGHCGQYCETSAYWLCHVHRYRWYRTQDYSENRPPRLVAHHVRSRLPVVQAAASSNTPTRL